MRELFDVLVTFTWVGLFGFGGGPSMIPLMQAEVVEVRQWLTRAEFLDAFAFGNTLPGPIATKLAGYIGYQVAGVPGAVAGLTGIAVPTVVAMVALAAAFARNRENPAVANFILGVRPVVVALLLVVVWDFAPEAFGTASLWLQNWPLWALALSALVLTQRYNVHPALLIVAGGLFGMVFLRGWQI